MTLQEIKDEIAPHLNLEECNSLLCFMERRIADLERSDRMRKREERAAIATDDAPMFMKLWKVSNRDDVGRHSHVEIDKVYEGLAEELPTVGRMFVLVRTTLQTMRTSEVLELLPDNQFKTKHSIYKYEILSK